MNPFPCTEVDENGQLRASINFGSCALPILLHGYAIHSARGPKVPAPGEPTPRPGRGRAPPSR